MSHIATRHENGMRDGKSASRRCVTDAKTRGVGGERRQFVVPYIPTHA